MFEATMEIRKSYLFSMPYIKVKNCHYYTQTNLLLCPIQQNKTTTTKTKYLQPKFTKR